MGIFDKALDRLATAIVKAAPTTTNYSAGELAQLTTNQTGYGTAVGLPRNPLFASVPFTPGQPIVPGAINPLGADGRPDPRRYEYQVAQNINITETRPVPFKTLRGAADQIDILRRCVEVLKQKALGLEWDITLSQDAVEQVMAETGLSQTRASNIAKEKFAADIARIRQFWETPDIANGLTFTDWLGMALEEVLVVDALAIWPQRTVGGDLRGLQILDGGTIKPLIDDRGMRPQPPFPAYQQILYGFPRSEFSAPTETQETDGNFTSDELAYFIRNRRTTSVYGFSPVERALPLADLYLRRQQWLRAEYTDGVLPELMFKTDGSIPPDLLRAYENVFNDDLAGQTEQRKRARLLPGNIEPVQYEGYGERFKDTLDDYLVTSICGHFGVQPSEIGFATKSSLGGAGVQEGQAESAEVIGSIPLSAWVARQITQMSYVFLGMPRELEFKFQQSARQDDEARARAADIRLKSGVLVINEERANLGLPLLESNIADSPILSTATGLYMVTGEGVVPLSDAITMDELPGGDMEEPPATEPAPAETEEQPTETEASEKSADIIEMTKFIRWLRKSPKKPFTFDFVPAGYAETLNKFVAVADFDGARWYAERYLD